MSGEVFLCTVLQQTYPHAYLFQRYMVQKRLLQLFLKQIKWEKSQQVTHSKLYKFFKSSPPKPTWCNTPSMFLLFHRIIAAMVGTKPYVCHFFEVWI